MIKEVRGELHIMMMIGFYHIHIEIIQHVMFIQEAIIHLKTQKTLTGYCWLLLC